METREQHRYCVIMCGGIGSRFWPMSRQQSPKQFLDFFGTGRTLLQQTVDRLDGLVPMENIYTVTNEAYGSIVREQLPELPAGNIITEPARRNTAPCVCLAAHIIRARDPEAVIVTLPSDHLILKEIAFQKALREGFRFVEEGDRLLTLGIKPSSPHTGYGYIQEGEAVPGWEGIMKVKSFTEKPDAEMAKVFLESGEFFWNAGIFMWSATSILKAFEQYAPEIASLFDKGDKYYGTPGAEAFIKRTFPSSPSISIDYAIMEKAANVYVKKVDLGWSDLGSWKALYEVSPKTREGNVLQGCHVMAENCTGTVFTGLRGHLIVAAGLHDYIVADTENALLSYPMSEDQKIRRVVTEIESRFGDKFI